MFIDDFINYLQHFEIDIRFFLLCMYVYGYILLTKHLPLRLEVFPIRFLECTSPWISSLLGCG